MFETLANILDLDIQKACHRASLLVDWMAHLKAHWSVQLRLALMSVLWKE